MNWFTKSKAYIKFKTYVGGFYVATPVQLARNIRVKWMKEQDTDKFSICPGMWDYANAGYIVTAHSDIHIKANKAGTVVSISNRVNIPELKYYPFNYNVVKGMAPIDTSSVKPVAGKIALPWSVQMDKGYSGYLMPCIMHSDFLDKIFIYPGVIDFDNFHTINMVFSPLKECDFTIPAGTPILQILPFRRERYSAECGKATQEEIDKHMFVMPSRIKHYYRKFLSRRKTYELTCPFNHKTPVNERPENDK